MAAALMVIIITPYLSLSSQRHEENQSQIQLSQRHRAHREKAQSIAVKTDKGRVMTITFSPVWSYQCLPDSPKFQRLFPVFSVPSVSSVRERFLAVAVYRVNCELR